MKRVAVEATLSPIREYLSRQGYQVENLNASAAQTNQGNYAAIILSGQDENVGGMQDVVQQCPVINAHGMTPEQVHERLQRLSQ
ncbi:YkuS family protein [Laceyella putida]|uniref:YkuS family protein n=1 Tax=Laceyella putida TaxID=110101 RepID=A0ABW2RJD2_9BACL